MEKFFYMPLEIKNRDFYSRLLISLELCGKHNFDIFFGYRGDVNYFAQNYYPGIYYGITTLKNFEKLFISIKKNNNILIISDEEGLVTYSPEYYKKFKVSKRILDMTDFVFTWGKKNSDLLRKICKNKSKIVITGNPRLDFLKKPLSNIYMNEIKKIKKKYGTFFLVATNFSYSNYFDKNVSYTDLLKKKDFFESSSDLSQWKKYVNIKKLVFDQMIKFIKKFKKFNLVIRCHPSENHQFYQNLEKNYKNVHFNSIYSLHPWILASNGVISHYCTSTFEALAAGKSVFTIKPNYKTPLEDDLYFKIPVKVKNYLSLVNKLESSNPLVRNSKILSYYSENFKKKEFSYKKIVNEIGKLDIQQPMQIISKNFITKFKFLKLKEKIKNLMLFRQNKYLDHKMQNITKEEIYTFINFFQSIEINLILKS